MGGNVHAIGNMTDNLGEFNFCTDPEAAKIVLDVFPINVNIALFFPMVKSYKKMFSV